MRTGLPGFRLCGASFPKTSSPWLSRLAVNGYGTRQGFLSRYICLSWGAVVPGKCNVSVRWITKDKRGVELACDLPVHDDDSFHWSRDLDVVWACAGDIWLKDAATWRYTTETERPETLPAEF